jgi:hypothetical protein
MKDKRPGQFIKILLLIAIIIGEIYMIGYASKTEAEKDAAERPAAIKEYNEAYEEFEVAKAKLTKAINDAISKTEVSPENTKQAFETCSTHLGAGFGWISMTKTEYDSSTTTKPSIIKNKAKSLKSTTKTLEDAAEKDIDKKCAWTFKTYTKTSSD